MGTPFLAEIRIFSFNFAPKGWTQCNGQLMAINVNPAIFSLLGTTYGGNGVQNFGLPNLQGLIPMHFGNGYTLGENSGEQSHTLLTTEVPAHTHLWNVTTAAANAPGPSGNLLGGVQAYNKTASNQVAMNTGLLSSFGGNQPHENRQPFLTLNFCIAISGIFPSRS